MRKPTVRQLRQRIVWRLFEARNRCSLAELATIIEDKSPENAAKRERAFSHFRRLAWELARQIHPARRRPSPRNTP